MASISNEKIFIQDGETVIELTGADKEAFLADRAQLQEQEQARQSAETARQTKLDSAITKLKALGLTESEAKIIIGLE
ncbi:hypothetical protein UFOVP688_2 [uncultured Caudovirales phage]|uniref:Uncharacterized protein n=1 Tax=uncultured Caudovirales phage TaxID=2100421 RepID=A0A6J5NH34_9CAUD|nr:hypothetical protein UFOVP688_2 [uncultured Caudovirales phage]